MSKRQQHAPEFKAKVALEALKGETDGIRTGQPVRGSSDDDSHMEESAAGRCLRRVRAGRQ